MHILSRLRLRNKLALLMALSALALLAAIGISASIMRQRMTDDRIDKLRAVVQTTAGLAQSLENQVVAHKLTREQALEQLRNAVHVMRFDAGDGYIVAQTLDNVVIVHGTNPKLENAVSPATDATGRSLTSILADTLRNTDQGFVSYSFVKPGETQPQPKVAYVARFVPWNLVFLAGAYTGDLDAAFHRTLWKLIGIAGGILLTTLITAWLINRDITGSLGRLDAVMTRLSQGELDTSVPGTDRRDEVGSMARAVLVFKDGLQQAERLRAEQETERARAEAARVAALIAMAETIETETRDALAEVGERTSAMANAAQ